MPQTIKGWKQPESPESGEVSDASGAGRAPSPPTGGLIKRGEKFATRDREIWFRPDLSAHEATAHLDSLEPATLYYLGSIIPIEALSKVYVEQRPDGCQKHWAVLKKRDFEAMDRIYDIEAETLDKFPLANLNFRVTIDTEEGPSVSESAVKIYDIN